MEVRLGVKAAQYESGESLADVMTWNNYGTETIPPRPVFQIAAEKIVGTEEFKKIMAAYLRNIAMNPRDADKLEKELLRKIGSQSIAECKRIINGGTELQENAPATVRKKGFNKPLYETGLMIKNFDYDYGE